MTPQERDEWIRRNTANLRPEDRELVRAYDPFTAGLTLLLLNGAREMAKAIFGDRP